VSTEPVPRAADADHLTQALRQSGSLGWGRDSNGTITVSFKNSRSHALRLQLDYDGADALAPASLILKLGHLDADGRSSCANTGEVAFYRDVASTVSAGLTPRCFEVVSATETSARRLLLEDLTDSHVIPTTWPLPATRSPMRKHSVGASDPHAAWWDHPLLGTAARGWRDQSAFERMLKSFAEQFARFIDQYGETVPSERRDLYQRLLDQAPPLLLTSQSHRDPRRCGSVEFLSAPGWRREERQADRLATDDPAYMMAMLS
jgi:hypothetical protein